MHRFTLSLLVTLGLLTPFHARAAADWGLCGVPLVTRPPAVDYQQQVTEISASRLVSEHREFLQFSGDVQLHRYNQHIRADELKYQRESGQIEANGQLRFADGLITIEASQLLFNNRNNQGNFQQASFQLYENHLRGEASQILQLDENRRELLDVRYTTCDPGQNHWSLAAGKLELDEATGMGTAQHTVMRIGSLPVLYFPWFRFPITDQRLSGVLPPTLSHSQQHGSMFSLPLYWNQAVNYDMTITPFWYSERGIQLNTENRYLFARHGGQLELSWLDDDLNNDERWYRRWAHQGDLGRGIQASLLVQKVSDELFLQDFDHLDGVDDVDFLKSSLLLSTSMQGWTTRLLLDQHQTIDQATAIASRPYKRLPRLTLDKQYRDADGSPYLTWRNEFVAFDREDSVTGDRLHIAPTLLYPMEGDYYFIRPSLQLDYSQYALDNNPNDSNDLSRSLPLLSIDSGLIFERAAGKSGSWLQTLEPRVYLLYVPYRDQSDIPLFDSALRTESYRNLFVNNRFSGHDRIGDSRQISLGLTTRLLSLTGREMQSASIGQAFYAEDRRVTLDNTIDESQKSSVMTLIRYHPTPRWEMQINSVYNHQQKESKQTDFALRRHSGQQVFNLEYHFRENELEQSTLSLVYPISVNWNSFFKYQHSLRNDMPVQNLLGMSYDSCCWRFDMLFEEESDRDFIETDRSVYFQLTFKGLGSAGNDITTLLEDGILGYQRAN